MVSVLFSKAKLAAGCAGILYFTSYVPCLYIAIREESLAYIDIDVTLKTLAVSCDYHSCNVEILSLLQNNRWSGEEIIPFGHYDSQL